MTERDQIVQAAGDGNGGDAGAACIDANNLVM